MYRLSKFYESDVNDKPTTDAIIPNRGIARVFPGTAFLIIVGSTLFDLIFGKVKVTRGRAKVRQARAEILPRAPDSLICPNCYEVLERF